jgi:hypothetical protein
MNTINLTLDQDDLNTLGGLLDIAVKASGIQGAKPALAILAKLEAAVAAANQPAPATDTNEGHA